MAVLALPCPHTDPSCFCSPSLPHRGGQLDLPLNPVFFPRRLFSCSISVLFKSVRKARRSQVELRAGAHSREAAQHHPVRNYRDLPSYYFCDVPGWCSGDFTCLEGRQSQPKLGCNEEKNAVNKASSRLCKLRFKLTVLLAASCVALRKSLCASAPLAVMVQGWFCHRGVVRINAAEAGKHCGVTSHLTVVDRMQ